MNFSLVGSVNQVGINNSKTGEVKKGSGDVFSYVTSVSEDMKKYLQEHPGSGILCPNGLSNINRALRWNKPMSDFEEKYVKALDSAFEKLPGLEEDKVFYRGVAGRDLDEDILKAQKDDIIVPDRGFPQVGLHSYYAEKYLPSEDFKPILFEMKCKKGSKVSLSNHTGTGAKEGMLNRGAKFKVLDKQTLNMPRFLYQDYETGAWVTEDRNVTKYSLELLN